MRARLWTSETAPDEWVLIDCSEERLWVGDEHELVHSFVATPRRARCHFVVAFD